MLLMDEPQNGPVRVRRALFFLGQSLSDPVR
jgi:hypothetical protein